MIAALDLATGKLHHRIRDRKRRREILALRVSLSGDQVGGLGLPLGVVVRERRHLPRLRGLGLRHTLP